MRGAVKRRKRKAAASLTGCESPPSGASGQSLTAPAPTGARSFMIPWFKWRRCRVTEGGQTRPRSRPCRYRVTRGGQTRPRSPSAAASETSLHDGIARGARSLLTASLRRGFAATKKERAGKASHGIRLFTFELRRHYKERAGKAPTFPSSSRRRTGVSALPSLLLSFCIASLHAVQPATALRAGAGGAAMSAGRARPHESTPWRTDVVGMIRIVPIVRVIGVVVVRRAGARA